MKTIVRGLMLLWVDWGGGGTNEKNPRRETVAMNYRKAEIEDIGDIEKLQKKYHIDTISEEDKADGFVTTLFTAGQFRELIEKEGGIALALDGSRLAGYAMAASWEYWSSWPLFEYMIENLKTISFLNQQLSKENSYQYGPICIDKEYRGTEVLPNLFETSRLLMKDRFGVLVTFINQNNPRSFKAHTQKLGLEVIGTFSFNHNEYFELGYDTSRETPGATTGTG